MTLMADPPRPKVATLIINVRCTQIDKKESARRGRAWICDHLLTSVAVDNWERDMSSRAVLICEGCNNPYRLADYFGML